MARDLIRILGLWSARRGWLLAGVVAAICSTLAGLALLVLAGRVIAGAVVAGQAGAALLTGIGLAALVWLRPVMLFRPVARYLDRLVTHEATFRALADMRVWFFRRLAERLPSGLGLREAGDLLGRLVADVESLDGLYLRVIVPAASSLAVVIAMALVVGAADPGLAALLALPLVAALLLPLVLAPAAARAGEDAARAQGALRSAVVDPLTGLEDTLAANGEGRAAARVAAAGAALSAAQRTLARRSALGGASGALLVQVALLGSLAWALGAGQDGLAAGLMAVFLAVAAAEALGLMPRAGTSLAAAAAGARRLFEAADAPAPVTEPARRAAAEVCRAAAGPHHAGRGRYRRPAGVRAAPARRLADPGCAAVRRQHRRQSPPGRAGGDRGRPVEGARPCAGGRPGPRPAGWARDAMWGGGAALLGWAGAAARARAHAAVPRADPDPG
jgi:ATP-binding cassette subfamily C protein CydC